MAVWQPTAPPGDTIPAPAIRPPRRRRFFRRFLILVLALVILAIMAVGIVWVATPSVSNAWDLARAQDRAHGVAFPGPAVPSRFATAVEATEDHRFGSEPGVDPFAIARLVQTQLFGGNDQGGATIYQQLAKLLYTGSHPGFTTEAKQVALAFKLSMSYSSAKILQMYADVAYYGDNSYGLQAASCGYFGIEPARLSWAKAALLAGLVQGPSLDDPLTNPARARAREEHVIGRLVATGKISQAQATRSLLKPISTLVAKAGTGCGA
jgi:membrane peptidoglycan carboxypeptidase